MRRWKTLKEGYKKHLQLVKDCSISGSANVPIKTWTFATVMSFMKDHLEKRDTTGNMEMSAATPQGPQHSSTFTSQGTSGVVRPPGPLKKPGATASRKRAHAAATHPHTFQPLPVPDEFTLNLGPILDCPAAQGTSSSLPSRSPSPEGTTTLPPSAAQDPSTLSEEDIPETQTQDNPDLGLSGFQMSEDEEDIPVPRKVRRHQANSQHQNMTAFQESLVLAMAETAGPSVPHTVPQALDGDDYFFLGIAHTVKTLSARGKAVVKMNILQAVNNQLGEL